MSAPGGLSIQKSPAGLSCSVSPIRLCSGYVSAGEKDSNNCWSKNIDSKLSRPFNCTPKRNVYWISGLVRSFPFRFPCSLLPAPCLPPPLPLAVNLSLSDHPSSPRRPAGVPGGSPTPNPRSYRNHHICMAVFEIKNQAADGHAFRGGNFPSAVRCLDMITGAPMVGGTCSFFRLKTPVLLDYEYLVSPNYPIAARVLQRRRP